MNLIGGITNPNVLTRAPEVLNFKNDVGISSFNVGLAFAHYCVRLSVFSSVCQAARSFHFLSFDLSETSLKRLLRPAFLFYTCRSYELFGLYTCRSYEPFIRCPS